ncbi:MAG: corrinoid activation/regeneration protein AcsV [Eubacteriaceae bacterium]|jgi:uncharacterized 2Fe-2S/4Fe-4S cluster protein (DUF4445 family)
MPATTVTIQQKKPVTLSVLSGTTLLDAVRKAGIAVDSPCNGHGTCGKCLVRILEGETQVGNLDSLSKEDREKGLTLACQNIVTGPVIIEVPEESRLTGNMRITDMSETEKKNLINVRKQRIREGMHERLIYHTVDLDLPQPSLDDNIADDERFRRCFRQATGLEADISITTLKFLPDLLRTNDFNVRAIYRESGEGRAKILYVAGGDGPMPMYGVAVDIGTTSVAALLVDMNTARVEAKASTSNTQASYGADVINRIVYAEKPGGLLRLREEIVKNTITPLIRSLIQEAGILPENIVSLAIAGNTTMTHLFLGISPEYLRREPYIPAITHVPVLMGYQSKLPVNPAADVWISPSVASYVGGDITAGVFAVPIWQNEDFSMLVDLGTNGEIVFGNSDFMMTCACSAGPAFEGGEIDCGSRALPGAIEQITIDDDLEPHYATINGDAAVSVCGSGIIDLICELKKTGIIDGRGKINRELDTPRIVFDEYGVGRYIIASPDLPQTPAEKEIYVTEVDIDNFIKAKGAVYSAIATLLRSIDMPVEVISAIYIAGGIGTNINIRNAIRLGMLPDIPEETYYYIGNSSLQGAYLALTLEEGRSKTTELAQNMTYIELSADRSYMDDFLSACFIPHTDKSLFPNSDI